MLTQKIILNIKNAATQTENTPVTRDYLSKSKALLNFALSSGLFKTLILKIYLVSDSTSSIYRPSWA